MNNGDIHTEFTCTKTGCVCEEKSGQCGSVTLTIYTEGADNLLSEPECRLGNRVKLQKKDRDNSLTVYELSIIGYKIPEQGETRLTTVRL